MITKIFVLMCSLALYKAEHDLRWQHPPVLDCLLAMERLVMCLQLGGSAAVLHWTATQSARMPLALEMILILVLVLILYMSSRTQTDWGREQVLLLRILQLMGMDG